MGTKPLSTAPQHGFEQADELFQQAIALRQEAKDLQEQIELLRKRADTLTTTAQGLQELAMQERDTIATMWEECLRDWRYELSFYSSDPEKAEHFYEMEEAIEDGEVNVADLNEFLYDVQDYAASEARTRRPLFSQPHTAPGPEESLIGQMLLTRTASSNSDLKGKISNNADAEETMTKTMRRDEDLINTTLANHGIIDHPTDKSTNLTDTKDDDSTIWTSGEGSDTSEKENLDPETFRNGRAISVTADEASSVSAISHATDEACASDHNGTRASNADTNDEESNVELSSSSSRSSTSDSSSSPESSSPYASAVEKPLFFYFKKSNDMAKHYSENKKYSAEPSALRARLLARDKRKIRFLIIRNLVEHACFGKDGSNTKSRQARRFRKDRRRALLLILRNMRRRGYVVDMRSKLRGGRWRLPGARRVT